MFCFGPKEIHSKSGQKMPNIQRKTGLKYGNLVLCYYGFVFWPEVPTS